MFFSFSWTSGLRSTCCGSASLQVEFESIKLELTQKNEEQEELRAQLEEAARLREIAEKQLDEALETLKEEREQKNSLRRELSALTLNPFDSVGNLELHLDQLDDSQEGGHGGEGEGEAEGDDQDSGYNNGPGSAPGSAHPPHSGGSKSNGLIHRYSTPRSSDVFFRAPASGLVSDLLSELHFSDSQKLKQQLLQVGSGPKGDPPLVNQQSQPSPNICLICRHKSLLFTLITPVPEGSTRSDCR